MLLSPMASQTGVQLLVRRHLDFVFNLKEEEIELKEKINFKIIRNISTIPKCLNN